MEEQNTQAATEAPATTPAPPKKKSKKTLTCVMIAIVLFACISFVCVVGILIAASSDSNESDSDIEVAEPESKASDTNTPSMNSDNVDVSSIKVESINNDNITSPTANQAHINEVDLALDTFKLLKQKGWNGNKDQDLPISISDYDQGKLKFYIQNQQEKGSKFLIPSDIEDVFSSTESGNAIQNMMELARQEYVDYLKAKGVNQKYIDEINNNVLPANSGRMQYHKANDPDADPSTTGGYITGDDGEKDYSQVKMNLYAADVYNNARMAAESGVLGEEPSSGAEKTKYWETARNIGFRHLMYHEMTHVLQRAYVNMNVDEKHKNDKVAYVYADKTMADIDDQYFWEWGGGDARKNSNNRHISQESQADGIAFEMVVNVFDMSSKQKQAMWDHFFGRLETETQNLEEIQQITEAEWPDLVVDETGDSIRKVMQGYSDTSGKNTLRGLTFRLAGFSSYVGYLNPVRPEDTPAFWTFLKS